MWHNIYLHNFSLERCSGDITLHVRTECVSVLHQGRVKDQIKVSWKNESQSEEVATGVTTVC